LIDIFEIEFNNFIEKIV